MLHSILGDEQMNKALRNQVQSVRGGMLETANETPIPNRFKVIPDPLTPSVHIVDSVSGKETCVPLFAYGNVRKSLNDLFG